MFLIIGNKKIQIFEYKKFGERFKTFKFYLKDINFGLKLARKKYANTYFFCQKVDVCFTDKNDRILYIYNNVASEKLIFKIKAHNIYYFPVGVCRLLKVGDIIKLQNK